MMLELADHPARAFRVQTAVFLADTRNTAIKLKKGEHLFVLTDNGLEEAPHAGPQEVMIVTEHFGTWPVVAIKVRAAHVERWRSVTTDDCARMMKRVRSALRAGGQR